MRDQKKSRHTNIIKYIYKNEENKTIKESTLTDRITHLTDTNALENKRSNVKDTYYLKDNAKNLETPYEYEPESPPPTDHPNTPSQKR